MAVAVNSKGAEVTSVKLNGVEYIWQANPEIWARHSPVLFPIVGKLKNNTYWYEGKEYSLPQHGFARDLEFELIHQTESQIQFELKNNSISEKAYPFQFKLQIAYTINNDELECKYTVINSSISKPMLFSIGAHPGFKIQFNSIENSYDYELLFEANRDYEITHLADGLLSTTKSKLNLNNGKLNITSNLFNNDALIFENSQINSIVLKSKTTAKGVELKCAQWPYFGIWSKKGCDEFVCLEPWYGITDTETSTGDLKTKKGIIELMPEKKFECSFNVRFF